MQYNIQYNYDKQLQMKPKSDLKSIFFVIGMQCPAIFFFLCWIVSVVFEGLDRLICQMLLLCHL